MKVLLSFGLHPGGDSPFTAQNKGVSLPGGIIFVPECQGMCRCTVHAIFCCTRYPGKCWAPLGTLSSGNETAHKLFEEL